MKNKAIVAIFIMAVGMILIPVGDSIAKHLSNTSQYSAHFLAWARFSIGGLCIVPFVYTSSDKLPHASNFIFKQLVRAVLIVLTVVLIIRAVGLSPVADVFGAFFIGPALSIVLSAWLLKEKPTTVEIASVALGFLGVLLVVQPEFLSVFGFIKVAAIFEASIQSSSGEGLYWALLSGIFYGTFLVATRWASDSGPPLTQVATQFIFAALLLTPFALAEFISLSVVQPWWLLLMGLSSVLANYCSVVALRHLSAPALAPVVYIQVVAATFIGYFIFDEQLQTMAALGIAFIVVSGLFRIKRV